MTMIWNDDNRTKVLHVCSNCNYNEAWHSKWYSTFDDWDKIECCKCGEAVWIPDQKEKT